MQPTTRRDVHRYLLAGLCTTSLPAPLFAQDDLAFVHPELRAIARSMLKMTAGMPEWSVQTLATTRQFTARWGRPPLSAPQWAKRTVPGLPGNPDVTVYVVNSSPGARRPAILHTHGGGYVTGAAGDGLADLQKLSAELDCTIVSADYRLAPETTWAGSVNDNYAALEWLHANAAALGVDRSRIAVLGESAGGGHAALLALKARDVGKVPLVAQILIYPMLDDRTGSAWMPPAPIGVVGWGASQNRFGWQSFLGQAPGTDQVPAAAVPARRTDLAGLPPAFIGVGSIDLFVDEDIAYARRLIAAGIPTRLEVVPGGFHGFDMIGANTKVARDFTAAKLDALRAAFAV